MLLDSHIEFMLAWQACIEVFHTRAKCKIINDFDFFELLVLIGLLELIRIHMLNNIDTGVFA